MYSESPIVRQLTIESKDETISGYRYTMKNIKLVEKI